MKNDNKRAASCIEKSKDAGSPELKAAWQGMAKYWVTFEQARATNAAQHAAQQMQGKKAHVDLDTLIKRSLAK
jgi:predicted lipid-binding transport protein (Tim44 family)